jgi:hypothetical protein
MPIARFVSIKYQFGWEGKRNIPIWDFGRDLVNLL